jgi:hypothetical protein
MSVSMLNLASWNLEQADFQEGRSDIAVREQLLRPHYTCNREHVTEAA